MSRESIRFLDILVAKFRDTCNTMFLRIDYIYIFNGHVISYNSFFFSYLEHLTYFLKQFIFIDISSDRLVGLGISVSDY